jgi:hypothetical protein
MNVEGRNPRCQFFKLHGGCGRIKPCPQRQCDGKSDEGAQQCKRALPRLIAVTASGQDEDTREDRYPDGKTQQVIKHGQTR